MTTFLCGCGEVVQNETNTCTNPLCGVIRLVPSPLHANRTCHDTFCGLPPEGDHKTTNDFRLVTCIPCLQKIYVEKNEYMAEIDDIIKAGRGLPDYAFTQDRRGELERTFADLTAATDKIAELADSKAKWMNKFRGQQLRAEKAESTIKKARAEASIANPRSMRMFNILGG